MWRTQGAIGCSLIKGIEFDKKGDFRPILISDLLKDEMQKGPGQPVVEMSVRLSARVRWPQSYARAMLRARTITSSAMPSPGSYGCQRGERGRQRRLC